jgi:hypothetical protein
VHFDDQNTPKYPSATCLNAPGINAINRILEPMNIEARYPTHKQLLKSLNTEKCAELLKQTQELFEWIKQKPQLFGNVEKKRPWV